MKGFLTALTFLIFSLSQPRFSITEKNCSIFITWNWGFSYPEMFEAQIDPNAGTIAVSPLSEKFGGITYIAVHEEINCGDAPLCSYDFDPPITSFAQLPNGLMRCANHANPMYLNVCWKEVKFEVK